MLIRWADRCGTWPKVQLLGRISFGTTGCPEKTLEIVESCESWGVDNDFGFFLVLSFGTPVKQDFNNINLRFALCHVFECTKITSGVKDFQDRIQ